LNLTITRSGAALSLTELLEGMASLPRRGWARVVLAIRKMAAIRRRTAIVSNRAEWFRLDRLAGFGLVVLPSALDRMLAASETLIVIPLLRLGECPAGFACLSGGRTAAPNRITLVARRCLDVKRFTLEEG
jgi:hypothetical protein